VNLAITEGSHRSLLHNSTGTFRQDMHHILRHHRPVLAVECIQAGVVPAEDNRVVDHTGPDMIVVAAGDSPAEVGNTPAEVVGRPGNSHLVEGTRPVVAGLGCNSLLRSWMLSCCS